MRLVLEVFGAFMERRLDELSHFGDWRNKALWELVGDVQKKADILAHVVGHYQKMKGMRDDMGVEPENESQILKAQRYALYREVIYGAVDVALAALFVADKLVNLVIHNGRGSTL